LGEQFIIHLNVALGHSRLVHSAPVQTNVRCFSNSGQTRVRLECPLSAKSGHRVGNLGIGTRPYLPLALARLLSRFSFAFG
jgi:hypothetical protein